MEREDQMRINLFARKNARLVDMREKITEKEVRKLFSMIWSDS